MLSQMKLAFEASWNRGGKMLIFIKVIGEYGNWTHSADSACLTGPASAEKMINHGISAKLQNRISTRPHGNSRRTYDNPEQAEKSALMSIPKIGASIELQKLNMLSALCQHREKCCAE